MKIKIAKNMIKILMDLEFLTLESFSETVLGKIRCTCIYLYLTAIIIM